MTKTSLLFIGVVLTVLASLMGLVIIPDWQLRDLAPYEDEAQHTYPVRPAGNVELGRRVYVDLGCIYCHSQQIRPEGFGVDLGRGWGMRRTVARDHIFDTPPLLGTMRTGPDLINIGARQPSRDWHLLHLYNPRITSTGSVMPPGPFLFDRVDDPDRVPDGAVRLPEAWAAAPAWIAPKARATQLVEYLRSLDHSYQLPEAP